MPLLITRKFSDCSIIRVPPLPTTVQELTVYEVDFRYLKGHDEYNLLRRSSDDDHDDDELCEKVEE